MKLARIAPCIDSVVPSLPGVPVPQENTAPRRRVPQGSDLEHETAGHDAAGWRRYAEQAPLAVFNGTWGFTAVHPNAMRHSIDPGDDT